MTETQDRLEERLTPMTAEEVERWRSYLLLIQLPDTVERQSLRLIATLDAALRQSQDIEAAARERASFIAYLWTATGKNHLRPVSDLFAEDDPIVADVERLSVDPTAALAPKAEEAPR